jgi:hypothetical protein
LAISLALHLVLFFLIPWSPGFISAPRSFVGPMPDDVLPGFELVIIRPTEPEPDPELIEVIEAVPVPEEVVQLPDSLVAPPPPVPVAGRNPDPIPVVGVEAPPGVRSAFDALRGIRYDGRLTEPLPPEIRDLSNERRQQLAFILTLREMNQAAALERERLEAWTDWTYTDDQGRRWGVSPGRLHLGDLTLPLPVYFGSSPQQQAEYQRRALDLADLQRAASSAEAADIRDYLARQGLELRRRQRADTLGGRGGGS